MEKNKGSFLGRIFRFVFSVVILSAFIIGISLFIKGIHNTTEEKLVKGIYKVLSLAKVKVDEDQVGEVAGKFIQRVSNTDISAISTSRDSSSIVSGSTEDSIKKTSPLLLEVAVIADMHSDLASLARTLNSIKEKNITNVIVIGDLTNYGDVESLQEVQKVLSESGLTYYVLPGDHDLAASVGPDNYIKVFGKDNYTVEIEDVKFVFLNNSANFTTLAPSIISWFNDEISNADFVILSQPLYAEGLNMPFRKMYMGSSADDPNPDLIENQQRVKSQRDSLLDVLQKAEVKAVLAGDHHRSNLINDPVNKNLEHHTLGSIAIEVNGLPQRLLQSPRFAILSIFQDKSFKVEDVLID